MKRILSLLALFVTMGACLQSNFTVLAHANSECYYGFQIDQGRTLQQVRISDVVPALPTVPSRSRRSRPTVRIMIEVRHQGIVRGGTSIKMRSESHVAGGGIFPLDINFGLPRTMGRHYSLCFFNPLDKDVIVVLEDIRRNT